jgi:hypothetical protein
VVEGSDASPSYAGYKSPSEIRVEWDVSPGEGGSLSVTVNQQNVPMSWQNYGIWGGSASLQKGVKLTLTATGTVGGSTKTKTAVFILVDDAPVIEAYFNGRLVNPTDTVTVSNPDISFSMKVTNAYYVKRFEFYIKKSDGTQLKYYSEWPEKVGPVSSQTYTYTLPAQGRYELTGYVVGSDDRRTVGLSLLPDFGMAKIDLRRLLNILTVPGMLMTLAGFALPEKRKK